MAVHSLRILFCREIEFRNASFSAPQRPLCHRAFLLLNGPFAHYKSINRHFTVFTTSNIGQSSTQPFGTLKDS